MNIVCFARIVNRYFNVQTYSLTFIGFRVNLKQFERFTISTLCIATLSHYPPTTVQLDNSKVIGALLTVITLSATSE